MMILWVAIGVFLALCALIALGVFGIWYAYVSGEEFQLEQLERKHGLRREEGHGP